MKWPIDKQTSGRGKRSPISQLKSEEHKNNEGQEAIILAYALLYAGAWFLLEYLRGDEDRGRFFSGALSTSQFIAILVGVASAILLAFRFNKGRHLSES